MKRVYKYECLNYIAAGLSGENFYSGLWGWTTIATAIGYGGPWWSADKEGPLACVLVALALPCGAIWNALWVARDWNNRRSGPCGMRPTTHLVLLPIYLMVLSVLSVPAWISDIHPSSPLWRYLVVLTAQTFLVKFPIFLFHFASDKVEFQWPASLDPIVSSHLDRMTQWSAWLGAGSTEQVAWFVTELVTASALGTFNVGSVQHWLVLTTLVTLVSQAYCRLRDVYDDVFNPDNVKPAFERCLQFFLLTLITCILTSCAVAVGPGGKSALFDPLYAMLVVSCVDAWLKVLVSLAVYVDGSLDV